MRSLLHQKRAFFLVLLLVTFAIAFLYHNQERPIKKDNEERPEDNTILIYNRIPKTGSTSLMHLAYEICAKNHFSAVLMNITSPSSHAMNFRDRLFFSNNVTQWSEKLPAIYHGHFAFFDVQSLATDKSKNVIYINVIRKPLDRLVSYYYFLRYGDDYRVNKVRSRSGNTQTFDECVEKQQPDCDPRKMWMQVPWFCGHHHRCWDPPGNSWALEQAKRNLANKYFLVGITEDLDSFVDMLEVVLPRFFRGAGKTFRSNEKLRHVRKTRHKDPLSNSTIDHIKSTKVWRKEQEFYDFAEAQFRSLKEDILKSSPTHTDFHYEKIRPSHKEDYTK